MDEIENLLIALRNTDSVSRDSYLRNFIMQNYSDFVISDRHYLEETSVLVEISLQNNYKGTLKILLENKDTLRYSRGYNNLLQALKDEFVLEEEYIPLVSECPKLLRISFENDFEKTLDEISAHLHSLWPNDEEVELEALKYEEYILEAMEKNEYVLDDNYENLQFYLNDVERVINISFDNDPINTVKKLLKYPYSQASKEFLYDINIRSVLRKDNNFLMEEDMYDTLSKYLSEMDLEDLVKHSFKNHPFSTLINGCMDDSAFVLKDMNELKQRYIIDLLKHNINKLSRKYEHRKAITNLFEKYPEIFVQLINEDYKAGVKFLGSVRVENLDKEKLALIRNELLKHDYVAGYIDNNIYLLELMFLDSLKNDFNKTIAHIDDVYTDEFYSEQLDLHGEELINIIVDNLAHNDCSNADAICKFIKCAPEILIRAMRINPYKTVANLSKIRDHVDMGVLSLENQKELEEILVKSNFNLLEEKNVSLMYVNSAFLIASLENNYEDTRKAVLERKPIVSKIQYSDEDFTKIIEIIKEHDDKELMLNVCAKNLHLLDKLLKENIKLAYEAINSLKSPLPLTKNDCEYLKDLIISLDENGKLDFKNNPGLVGLLSWGLLKGDVSNSEKERYIEDGLPLSFLSLNDRTLLSKYVSSEELRLYDKIYFTSGYDYDEKDEEDLLKCLGSRFDSIEDELAYLQTKKYTRKDLTPGQMLLLIMFTKKDQAKKGLYGYQVSIYDYNDKETALGVHKNDRKHISIFNGHDSTIAELVKTIVHENNHARQHLDTINCDVWNDSDIVVYSKDEILRIILRDLYQLDFYDENYWTTLVEHDAELKAQLQVATVLRMDPDSEELTRNIEVDSRNRNFVAYGLEKNKYTLSGTRSIDGENLYLDEIFDREINKALLSGAINKVALRRKYPIISYEYDLTVTPIKKIPIKDLMIRYIIGDQLDKDIYRSIIKYKLNPLYHKDYKENISEFKEAIEEYHIEDTALLDLLDSSDVIGDKTQEIKERILSLDKYLKLAEEHLSRESSMSREEFSKRIRK